MNIGLISDTHGLLRPEAVEALRGCELIVHAGDIGAPEVLDGLRALAPVVAVRGNNDGDAWAQAVPETRTFAAGPLRLHLLHDLKLLDLDPRAAQIAAVVSGHSHRPRIYVRDGVSYINPGSAGPRRFSLPVSLALAEIDGGAIRARIVELL
ncbi:metallophosphoesterase family protein [Solimonas soli]|uniref:metallophosphoesterase family protein n=1 Tax=Solimonas soli TaxID=413479 RepID=UPI0004845257|nr:metallophosphoesterase family protein [Solimonas soli]